MRRVRPTRKSTSNHQRSEILSRYSRYIDCSWSDAYCRFSIYSKHTSVTPPPRVINNLHWIVGSFKGTSHMSILIILTIFSLNILLCFQQGRHWGGEAFAPLIFSRKYVCQCIVEYFIYYSSLGVLDNVCLPLGKKLKWRLSMKSSMYERCGA